MRVIAFYLPQYYTFPENDAWWGKGFTEWTNVKKSKPLFKGHYQPTVPLNKNYYCLENPEVMRWQIGLAKEYGVYGFCFYHYYFGNGKFLMQKPLENYLADSTLDLPFCLCWANHNWSRTWVGDDKQILMNVEYGTEKEWKYHFDYLKQYFKDKRYIRVDNKPVLLLYQPQDVPQLKEMINSFNKWAKAEGLDGLVFISQSTRSHSKQVIEAMDYFVEYQPNYSLDSFWGSPCNMMTSMRFSKDMLFHRIKSRLNKLTGFPKKPFVRSYSATWDFILKHKPVNDKMICGAFVRCDVSPRRQERATIFTGDTPQLFQTYMQKLVKKVKKEYSTDIIFLSAWNEWGEGMYLEPDEKNQYGYLEAIRKCLEH